MDAQKYTTTATHSSIPEGSVVYRFGKYDYGLSRDDTAYTGEDHVSVTLDETGDYPFISVPVRILKAI